MAKISFLFFAFFSCAFQTASAEVKNLKTTAWRIAVISDMNKDYGDTEYHPDLATAIQAITNTKNSQPFDLVLSTGDMVSGQKAGLDYQKMWNSFHQHVTMKLQNVMIPFAPSAGNHDASAEGRFRIEREFYVENWKTNALWQHNSKKAKSHKINLLAGVSQNYPLHYAFTMGQGLFIALDATLPGGLAFNQLQWLEQVLEVGKNMPFKVIFGHFPLLPFAFDRAHEHMAAGTTESGFRQKMESLLEKYNVSLFLSGHHHVYYDGVRQISTRFVSVPLLGTGARFLLTRNREVKERASRGFLVIDFNNEGEFELQAIATPDMQPISLKSLPKAISIPTEDSTDCRRCSTFADEFFLNPTTRSVYDRSY